jgi:hypothetical protein
VFGAITKVARANQMRSTDESLEARNPFHSLSVSKGPHIRHARAPSPCLELPIYIRVMKTYHSGSLKNVTKNSLMPVVSSCKMSSRPNKKKARCLFLSLGQRAFQAAKPS